jgi:hypothetical protein
MFRSPEAALCRLLQETPSVARLCGFRQYPSGSVVGEQLPFIAWRRSAIQRMQTLQHPAGLPKVTAEFSVYAATYEAARETADAMRHVLDGYGGQILGCTVSQVSLENESDDLVSLAGGDLPPVYQITQQYDILWQE